jgi:hypothetical protein
MMQMGQYKYNTYVLYSVIDYLNIFYKMRWKENALEFATP